MKSKRCSGCKLLKTEKDFHKNNYKRIHYPNHDGLFSRCKLCRSKESKPNNKSFYLKNKEQIKEGYLRFLLKNPSYRYDYWNKNKELINARRRQRYADKKQTTK